MHFLYHCHLCHPQDMVHGLTGSWGMLVVSIFQWQRQDSRKGDPLAGSTACGREWSACITEGLREGKLSHTCQIYKITRKTHLSNQISNWHLQKRRRTKQHSWKSCRSPIALESEVWGYTRPSPECEVCYKLSIPPVKWTQHSILAENRLFLALKYVTI